MVDIYSEPIVNVGQTVIQWFGSPSNPAIIDICILFSYLLLFVFILSVFALFFKFFR